MGVPPEWISDVKAVDEDVLLTLLNTCRQKLRNGFLSLPLHQKHKDAPSAEEKYKSIRPIRASRCSAPIRPDNVEELEAALEYPWEKWTVFLHPEQRNWVERDYSGPAKVAGSAGTGKTVVALHRAAYLARSNPNARILLATFTDTLARALKKKILRLLGGEILVAEQIEVYSLGTSVLVYTRPRLGC